MQRKRDQRPFFFFYITGLRRGSLRADAACARKLNEAAAKERREEGASQQEWKGRSVVRRMSNKGQKSREQWEKLGGKLGQPIEEAQSRPVVALGCR